MLRSLVGSEMCIRDRWNTSRVPRYRKEEEAASMLSPRRPSGSNGNQPVFPASAEGTGRPVTLETAQDWYDVSNLGAAVLEHKLVHCRKPESSSPHARWSSTLRAPTTKGCERVAAYPDGHLKLHSLAHQEISTVQARHAEAQIRPLVPPQMGRIKPAPTTPRMVRPQSAPCTQGQGDPALQGQVTPEVARVLQSMKRHGFVDCYLFHRMDLDRNGQVSLNEFKKGLRLLHIKLNPQELKRLFSHFDRDNSGRIDYTELQLALRSINPDGSQHAKPSWNMQSPRYNPTSQGEFAGMLDNNNN
eukprot:TRINITY_DN1120_c0_g1_i2.p1 TRINITY_DN1120_c0_g1~~TRINITY_DN1120_c0_g1_i2.p1  ORF type:complete len:302 (+),score=44.01 TRINITY_DN1120_c0_g1_i2:100-1005(+)